MKILLICTQFLNSCALPFLLVRLTNIGYFLLTVFEEVGFLLEDGLFFFGPKQIVIGIILMLEVKTT